MTTNTITTALHALLSNPQNAAMVDDYMAARVADIKRMDARHAMDDARSTGTEIITVSPASDGTSVIGRKYGTRSAHGGLTDHASRVAPLVGHVAGAYGVQADENATDDVWAAIECVRRDGFNFGGTVIPFTPIATRRAIDAAHRVGAEFHIDRLDDVISVAIERAYATLSALAANVSADDVVTYDAECTGYHAPINGHVAGYLVTRDIRCGQCLPCAHDGSRYVVGGCVSPTSIVEFVDAQRVVTRALYASAAASVTQERYVDVMDVLPDTHTVTDDVDLAEGFTVCDHDECTTPQACSARAIVRVVANALAATGTDLVAGNGRASQEAIELITLLMGRNAESVKARTYAMETLRGMLRNVNVEHMLRA